jgi:hypothetical protein
MAKTRKGIEKGLLISMRQAVEFAKGARKGYVVHEFTSGRCPPDPCEEQAKRRKAESDPIFAFCSVSQRSAALP